MRRKPTRESFVRSIAVGKKENHFRTFHSLIERVQASKSQVAKSAVRSEFRNIGKILANDFRNRETRSSVDTDSKLTRIFLNDDKVYPVRKRT